MRDEANEKGKERKGKKREEKRENIVVMSEIFRFSDWFLYVYRRRADKEI
jgi:hypothetical protein